MASTLPEKASEHFIFKIGPSSKQKGGQQDAKIKLKITPCWWLSKGIYSAKESQ